jgi:hypothetical protein
MSTNYVRKTVDLFISDKLRSLLEEFKNDSMVAQMLLHRRVNKDDLQEDPINYISISDSDVTKISYLTQDRIKKVEESSKDDYWTTSIRFHCKPGAFVSKIFKDIPSKEVEKFSNLFKAFSSKKELKFSIVRGDDIKKYYSQDFYQTQSGSIGASCMKYSKCQNYFDIYTNNDSVSMLIMKSPVGDSIIGRALLWDFVCECGECECGDVKKVMDRIYTIQDDEYQIFFKKWADENGYIYKTNQNWSSTLQFDSKSETSEHKFGIKVNIKDVDRYPYLDTFKWLDLNAQILYNYRPEYFINDMDTFRLLASPDGRYTDIDYIKFDNIDRDWEYPGNLVCYDGENYTNSDNCHYSETLDRYILRSESEYNEELRDYIYTDLSRVEPEILEKRRSLFTKNENTNSSDKFKTMITNAIVDSYFTDPFLQNEMMRLFGGGR